MKKILFSKVFLSSGSLGKLDEFSNFKNSKVFKSLNKGIIKQDNVLISMAISLIFYRNII
jgi:hypothetical protein